MMGKIPPVVRISFKVTGGSLPNFDLYFSIRIISWTFWTFLEHSDYVGYSVFSL